MWEYDIYIAWDSISRILVFELGDGAFIRFWDDVWYGESPMKFVYLELYQLVRSTIAFVADVHCL